MADVFLHASSSLRLYRALDRDVRAHGFASSGVASLATATDRMSHAALSALARHGLGGSAQGEPLNILLPTRIGGRRCQRGIHSHVWSGPLTSGSFLTCGDGVYVSSPEFSFLQMAAHADVVKLAVLGMELCGTYRLREDRTAFGVPQLTTVRRIESYLSRMVGAQGARKAREALRFVTDNSGSPRETVLCLLLCLPPSIGGFGLPLPSLGDPTAQSARQRESRRSILSWPGTKVVLTDHACQGAFAQGEVIIGRDDLRSDKTVRDLAHTVASGMDLRIRGECRTFMSARELLRARVIPLDDPKEIGDDMVM